MGAILGTVPGWQRDVDWTSDNRMYKGAAYIKYEVPPKKVEKRYEYRGTINITIYLCDSPCVYPDDVVVVRKIEGIKIIHVYEKEYEGGLDKWIKDVSVNEAEELASRSSVEVAGLCLCESEELDVIGAKIEIVNKEFIG